MLVKETELYQPVKDFLQAQGFEVKAEVENCDLVAIRGCEAPLVVELKRSLNLEVLLQAVDRTRLVELVYVAVPEAGTRGRLASRSARRSIGRMFQMLGIGLLTVGFRVRAGNDQGVPVIEVLNEPAPYAPRKNLRQQRQLRREFHARVGDFNTGGSHAIERLTAYRQDALICASFLHVRGASAPAQVKKATGVERAGALLYRNVYGWFERPQTGCYELSDAGHQALLRYHEVVSALMARHPFNE